MGAGGAASAGAGGGEISGEGGAAGGGWGVSPWTLSWKLSGMPWMKL